MGAGTAFPQANGSAIRADGSTKTFLAGRLYDTCMTCGRVQDLAPECDEPIGGPTHYSSAAQPHRPLRACPRQAHGGVVFRRPVRPVREWMPMAGEEQHEHDAILEVVERLTKVFSPAFSEDQVGAAVDTHYRRFDGSKVRTYVPLLVEHGVRDQLRSRWL